MHAVPMSSGQPWIVHQAVLSRLAAKVKRYLRHEHARTPLEPAVQLSRMARYFSELSSGQFDALLAEMASRGKLRLADGVVALAEWAPRLSAREQQWQTEMIRKFREAGLQPPSPAQVAEELGCSAGDLAPLLNLAQSQQTLTRIAADVLLHAHALQKAEEEVCNALSDNRQMTVSEIRDVLQTTRKIAVPLCEHFDSIGLTMREGDVRRLGDRFSQAAAPP